ncbi:MAG: aldehyde dehydrogenase family protein [Deltaproteobacteria bacterium]
MGERYVKLRQAEGAKLLTGGKCVVMPGLEGGYYYAPTIFTDVKNAMLIAEEEIFGPVVCVIKYDSDEEAAAIANAPSTVWGRGIFFASFTYTPCPIWMFEDFFPF